MYKYLLILVAALSLYSCVALAPLAIEVGTELTMAYIKAHEPKTAEQKENEQFLKEFREFKAKQNAEANR